MSLLILVPDIHDGIKQFNSTGPDGIPIRLAESTLSKQWIAEVAVERKADMIIQMGDYWDEPNDLDGLTVLHSLKAWNALPVPTMVLRGNHDFRAVFDASELLSICSNTTVVAQPTSMFLQEGNAFLGFIPFQRQEEAFKKISTDLEKIADQHGKKVKKYLFIHQGVQGFIPNADEAFSRDCVTPEKWTKIFSGHYHSGFENGFIHYLGSLVPTAFESIESGGCTTGKGITLLNTNTGEIEFIENPHSPIFSTCDIEDYEDLLREAISAGTAARTYVKVIYENDTDLVGFNRASLHQFRDHKLVRQMTTMEKERNYLWRNKAVEIHSEASVIDLAIKNLNLNQKKDPDFLQMFRKIGESDILRKG